MLKVHKQEKAEDDLIEIWLYSFGEWGEHRADQYLDRLDQAIQSIATNPEIGVACNYLREDYRKLHNQRHYIFYRCTSDTVFIVRILGEEMDYQPILQEGD